MMKTFCKVLFSVLLSLTVCIHVSSGLTERVPNKPSEDGVVDLVTYSFDRPMQLEAFLESVERYISGLKNVTVIYRVSSQAYENAYQRVFAQFPYLRIIKQGRNPRAEFKPLTIKHVYDTDAEYILFGCDDLIMTGDIDLHFCVKQLQDHDGYTFILRLGDNITHMAIGTQLQSPPRRFLFKNDEIRVWRFSDADNDWQYAHSLEMAVYKKQDLKPLLEVLDYAAPNSLESALACNVDTSKIGICFARSKLINSPVNKVQQENGNLTNNQNPPSQLLNQYNQGLKIDVERYYLYPNNSPHQYIPLYLIPRV